MQRRVESALVAKVGTFVFAGILGLPVTLPASGGQTLVVASASRDASLVALFDAPAELADMRALVRSSPVARGGEDIDLSGAGSVTSAVPPDAATGPAAAGAVVLASWYGPGFYGNRTACGLTLTPELVGVAHLTLPCGTRVTLTSPAGRTLTVPVIDRGPYVAGRTLDLSLATKLALACSDVCSVRMVIGP
jgi:rare lipoprotein A (RlpA)-like double-psi beta-barrel protein